MEPKNEKDAYEANKQHCFSIIEYLLEHPWEITPSEEIFNEIVEACVEVWHTYDDTHGYRTEKLERVRSTKNYKDNVMGLIRMFHPVMRYRIVTRLSKQAQEYINLNSEEELWQKQ